MLFLVRDTLLLTQKRNGSTYVSHAAELRTAHQDYAQFGAHKSTPKYSAPTPLTERSYTSDRPSAHTPDGGWNFRRNQRGGNAEPNRSYIGRRSGTGAVNVMALKWRMIGLGVAGRVSADLRRIDPYDALLRPVLPRWQAGLADPQLPASIRNLGQHKRNCAVLNRSSVAASHGFYLHSAASKNETPCRFLPSK